MDLFKLSTTHRLTISSFESLLFTLQIFNLDTRANVKSHIMPEPWVRWKWTSVSNLGDVTASWNMQLYSIEKKASQPMNGHAASFLRVNLAGRTDPAHQQYSYLLDIHTGKLCIVPESLNRTCSLIVVKRQRGQALLSVYEEV